MTSHRIGFTRIVAACALLAASAYAAEPFFPGEQPTGWVGEPDVSGYSFSSGTETIYKPTFTRANWAGNLFAYPVDAAGVVNYSAERWSGGAAAQLALLTHTTRNIVTKGATGGIPFQWTSLSPAQQNMIAAADSLATNPVLDYIRGDRSRELPTGTYRKRSTVLGAIVHSRPIYVPDAVKPRVYVGANDGMLHAFNATTGKEEFAYIPSMLLPRLKEMIVDGDPYMSYFVDGSPNARKVDMGSGAQIVLVGGLGPGGIGLYALDVTPEAGTLSEAGAAGKVLWEITNTGDYADLGYTYGVPLIVKMKTGRWAAVVGNGYMSARGYSVLYVIDLADGSLIRAIPTTAPGTVDAPSGLSSPAALDVNADGSVEIVYAGDIDGNLWKFDLTDGSASAWTATRLYTTSPPQPITGAPSIALHPEGGLMINFATGRIFTADDRDDISTFYAYGIRDSGAQVTDLVDQTLTDTTIDAGGHSHRVRTSSSHDVAYATKQGWRLALPDGERVVGDGGLSLNGRYAFTATNPTITHAPVTVNGVEMQQPDGEDWLYEVAFDTGGGGSAPVFDLDNDGTLGNTDRMRSGTSPDPDLAETGVPIARLISTGVLSQPLIAQIASLSKAYFNSNPDLGAPSHGGVSGGHFDYDIYYNACTASATKYACPKNTHVHEYDDKFNVTGVNMLNASTTAMNLDNAIASTATRFKMLVMNQKLSPAVNLNLGMIVAAGDAHTCAARIGGGAQCWGSNGSGQLGDNTTVDRIRAVDVKGLSGSGSIAIAAGGAHSCVLNVAGGVKCWGSNGNGRLGDGTTVNRWMAVNVSGLGSGVSAIAAGGSHTCALTTAGAVKCWGSNLNGQLGNNSTADSSTPVSVSNLTSGVTAIAAGGSHTCALTSTGAVKCWGKNENGQLGNNTTADSPVPVNVSGLTTGATAIAAGGSHACAVSGNAVKCWGSNGYGQLGNSTTTESHVPVSVAGLTGSVAVGIAAGGSHTCAGVYPTPAGIKATTRWGAKCWGRNDNGQLGDGSTTLRSAAVDVTDLATGVLALAGGGNHTCAVVVNGVRCTGQNGSGQLGAGNVTEQHTMVAAVDVTAYTPVYELLTPAAFAPPPALDSSNSFVNSLPTFARSGPYTRSGLLALTANMPLNSFESKVWVTGDIVRAGLVPTQTGCVHANKYGYPNGAWMNGALTIQIIKENTPDSVIQYNVGSDGTMGYRLKSDAASQAYQLAEYTTFWHNQLVKPCYGDNGWIPNPPQDFAGNTTAQTPAPGSADPTEGIYGSDDGGGGSGGGGSTTITVIQYFYPEGTWVIETATHSATDNSVTVTTTYSGGGSRVPPPWITQSDARRAGRVSWKEMLRN